MPIHLTFKVDMHTVLHRVGIIRLPTLGTKQPITAASLHIIKLDV